MKRFRYIILGTILTWILLSLLTAVSIAGYPSDRKDRQYIVEINRLQASLSNQGEYEVADLSGCRLVKQVDYYPADSSGVLDSPKLMNAFFEGDSVERFDIREVPKGLGFLIKPFYSAKELKGYIRYSYSEGKGYKTTQTLVIAEVIVALVFIPLITLLIYIRRSILKPFNEISKLPYELTKGHLPNGIKETKSRYFGKFIWGLNMLRDNLEEHKRKELELEKDKKLMILSVSHDIKTPLSTIKLYSKALYEDLYDSEEKKHNTAKLIEEKADQIEKFIAEIIKASSTELFNFEVKSEEFYLSKLMTDIRRIYDEKLDLLKIEFKVYPYSDKLLSGDFEKLIDVFDNLLQNAIKYGDGRNITIAFGEEDNCQLIKVINTGDAIPSTDFIHMFESFWRGANASGKQGNGLGLYICRQLLLKMGGDIFAEVCGEGMCLTVVLRKS